MRTCNILFLIILLITSFPGCKGEEKIPPASRSMQETALKTLHQGEYKAYITNLMDDSANIFILLDTLEWIDDNNSESGFSIRNIKKNLLRVKLSDTAKIIMQTYSRNTSGEFNHNQKITAEQFISYLRKNTQKLRLVPFSLSISYDEVQSVNEIYIP